MTGFDYIVVGGGSAGCVLASRLSEDPETSVLLIEAGGRDRSFLYHWPAGFARMTRGVGSWGWSTVPQRHMQDRVLWYTQARVIGGGSSINAQIYARGNRRDYDRWETEAGCEGWSYRDVLPYFRRAEGNERLFNAYHGEDGPLGVSNPKGALPICEAFIRAGQEWGMPYNPDFNGATQAGVGFYQLTQRDRRRSSTAVAYLRAAAVRPNLTVRTDLTVARIRLDGECATGIETVTGEFIPAAREVVLSAGAIGSPRLLMLSGIGPADHLRGTGLPVRHDLPGVGENLQDHLDLCVLAECTGPHSYDPVRRLDRSALAGLQYLLFKSGPVTASLFETGGFWYADSAAEWPDMQFHFGQGSGIEKGIVSLSGSGVTLNSALMRPRSRGTVRLASADPAAAPLIDPNYWSDPYDLEMSLEGLRMAREILAQPALRPYIRREALPGPEVNTPGALFDYACRMAKTDHHPVGTCRMGHDDMAVVTSDLRLRGMTGLRIADASVMPLIPSANTNAATIMIAEKAADLIRGRQAPAPAEVPQAAQDRAAVLA
ncbi:GMC family oxidoreductase [Paenirhodobacter populi]|uniref:FAD-dependent oxidoreductase n=1 Tax=Paenirhodobacter populi TaxID=2306993 RepID=A0A443J5B4_9RHOB|nr:GMC family oxidoreductase N-terminal domain-containing protein [Sinirhodobacter populi]RWR15523.1 FAD-dependent oxidoreductase [Sinirhodobacter populi]